jgi:hypothetical protein
MVVFDRVVSLVLASVLLAFGVLVVVEVVHTALGVGGHVLLPWESLARYGRTHRWGDNQVRALCAGVAAVGALLLGLELRRRRPAALTLATDDDTLTAGMTRRSLRQALRTRAYDVDGVVSARVRLRRRRAWVTATTVLSDPVEVRDRLAAHLAEWVDHLGLVRPPTLAVRVRRGAEPR